MSMVRSQLKLENNESTQSKTIKNCVEIKAIEAEISEIKSDAIVHYTSTSLSLREDPDIKAVNSIGRTIFQKTAGRAQEILTKTLKDGKPLTPGEIAVTDSFGLDCKHIFHLAIIPTKETKISRKLYSEAKLFKAISTGVEGSVKTAESMQLQSLAIPLLKRKSHHFPITLVTEIYCNALAQVIENHQFDYLEHITLVTNQDPGALKLLKSYLNQRTLQVAQDEELNVDDEELDELLDFELDQLDCSFEPDSGLTDKCYLSEMEQKAPAELDLKDSSIPKKQMTINLLPIREARLRTTRSSELFSIASIGLFSIASILKKSYLWDKASSKTKKSKVKRNSVVATKLPSEVVTGPEKIETKLDDLKIDFDLEPKIEKSLLEEVKAQLHTANLKVTNLREQLRITRDELDKFYALKNIPGEEYRSAALPVALAHNMVESEIAPMHKMEKLRRSLGIVLRYFASIVFADYHALGCFSAEESKICREAFSRPVTDGTWFFAAEKIVSAYVRKSQSPALIKEIPYLWFDERNGKTKYNGLCRGLIDLRNEIHGKLSVDDTTAGEWLKRALPKWNEMLEAALPLCKYRLFYLEGIDDFGEDGEILYHVKWVMGEHLVPRSERVQWRKKLRKGKLYLWDPETNGSLDLTPFMAYEYNDITKTRETYCIEQIVEGRLTFGTLRFPDKAELPNHQQKIFTRPYKY